MKNFEENYYSPFQPGYPVSPDNFKGRKKDINKIIRYIPRVIDLGMPEHYFITGKRGYSKSKIQENLEAEALGVCTSEAYEIYKYKVIELDMTNLKTDEAVELVKKAIAGDVTSPPGSVEFSDWIIANL